MAFGDLTTFASLRQWLDVSTAVPTNDFAMLEGMITAVSDWIHNWTNRFFPAADYEEIRDGTGGFELVFANYPVLSVESVNVDNVEILAAPNTLSVGYMFSPTRIVLRGHRFSRTPMNTVIRYRAGFLRIPPSVSQAANELVAKQYRERSRIGVKQETIVGVDSYTYNVTDLLPDTRSALLVLRNVTPVSAFSRRLAPTQTDTALLASAL